MDPAEIWDTIVKADEALKYATDEKAGVRREQARRLLEAALRAAEESGNQALIQQARTRLEDLGPAPGEGQPA